MTFVYTALILTAPLWVPFVLTALYAFGIRSYVPKNHLPIADTLYLTSHALALLTAITLFVLEIFSWQLALLYRILWLILLGVPMLGGVCFVIVLCVMASDSW